MCTSVVCDTQIWSNCLGLTDDRLIVCCITMWMAEKIMFIVKFTVKTMQFNPYNEILTLHISITHNN